MTPDETLCQRRAAERDREDAERLARVAHFVTGSVASVALSGRVDRYSTMVNSKLTVRRIITVTAKHFGVRVSDILGPSKRQPTALARQAVCYLIRREFEYSYPVIAGIVGLQDHTTVMHACKVTEKRRLERPVYNEFLCALEERLLDPDEEDGS